MRIKSRLAAALLVSLAIFCACGKTEPTSADAENQTQPPQSEPPQTTAKAPLVYTSTGSDGGQYYNGALGDIIRFAVENREANRLVTLTNNFFVFDVSVDGPPRYRYAIFKGEKAIIDDVVQGAPPEISHILCEGLPLGGIVRLKISRGEGRFAVQYFPLDGGEPSRIVEYSGPFADWRRDDGGVLAAYFGFGARRGTSLLVEDMLSGNVMEVQRAFPNDSSICFLGNQRLLVSCETAGGPAEEIMDIDFSLSVPRISDDGENDDYNIKTKWQTRQDLSREAAPVKNVAGFAFGLEYDEAAGEYAALDDISSYVVDYYVLTNHSVTLAVPHEYELDTTSYGHIGASVFINDRIVRMSRDGTRIIQPDYIYGSRLKLGGDDAHQLVTVYFSRDFAEGEIKNLSFSWGKLD